MQLVVATQRTTREQHEKPSTLLSSDWPTRTVTVNAFVIAYCSAETTTHVNMSRDTSRESDEVKTKPLQKLASFSISSILGETLGERTSEGCPRETRDETRSPRDTPRREATRSPRDTVGVMAPVFDPEATAKLAAMTAWYPWIFQHAQHYSHFPFVEGTCCA